MNCPLSCHLHVRTVEVLDHKVMMVRVMEAMVTNKIMILRLVEAYGHEVMTVRLLKAHGQMD